MLLYADILTQDEMFSDAFPVKLVDDIVYEEGVDVDIGANPSAEEQDEGLDDGTTQVNNVVHSFRLQPTTFDKKSFLAYLKSYMKAVKVEAFEKGASAYAKKIIANFKDFEFVSSFGGQADKMLTYFTFWKDGLKEVKL
ncbi:translationally controlled tumor-associated [Pisolithus croceorrhizus]|nr:translationally controlled tumor-associated [Pisolithus croceorrhizus]